VIALPLAIALGQVSSRWLSDVLFELTPTDAASFTAAAAVLIVVGVCAAAVPTRRASRVDPMVALRE
jgi:ABC-type antimicrobial peptide transport system permease subunit